VIERDRLYLDGTWATSEGTGVIEVICPSTEEVMGHIPQGSPDDVDAAVAAARAAFPAWSKTAVPERVKLLSRLCEGLGARTIDIANAVCSEMGMPLHLAMVIQVGLPIRVMGSYAMFLESFSFEERVDNSLVVREPIGVVGCIAPWNYPLHQMVAKVAPALAAGCTVVVKPSEVAPFTAFILAEAIEEAGVPPGVFNLVTGTELVGQAITAHPDIDMVSFTGSVSVGCRVAEAAAQRVKRVVLELGGKSANVVLDDADLKKAVAAGVTSCFLNSGQTCNSLTRLLIPTDRQAEVEELAAEVVAAYRPGDPFDSETSLGPLASASQRDRVQRYIAKGIEEGARLVTGGLGAPEGLDQGYYVKPTIFSDVRPSMTIAQEEIFGPVLSIITYDSEDEAIEIANGTDYGLAAAVWSGDPERARWVARQLVAGQVDINGGSFNPLAPFGGWKRSGYGRELGRYGFEEYLGVKSLQL
jgi:aldehyde dehydrogenase (NAD+)